MKLCLKIPILRTFYRQYAFAKFQKAWRKRNAHNRTVAMNVFPMECVEVGNGTYGELHVLSYFPEVERLSIGNYVSMASNIHFILNGNHQTRTLFTYPLRSVLQGTQCPEDNLGKGPIIVEDEAWIGYGAIILSGVTLGKGCIVAAGSVVTRSIPPYAIAGGNPARVIRYRLPEEVIPIVKDIRLDDLSPAQMRTHIDGLYRPIQTPEDALRIVKTLQHDTRQ